MKKIKTVCHVCEKMMKSEDSIAACTRCAANLANPTDEIVQKKAHCQSSVNALPGWTGWLYLTNKRLLWIKDTSTGIGAAIGGLVGELIESAVTAGKNKVGFSIPLDDIVSVEDGKFGLFAKAIIVNTKAGVAHKLGVKSDWKALLVK